MSASNRVLWEKCINCSHSKLKAHLKRGDSRLDLHFDLEVPRKILKLSVCLGSISNVRVEKDNDCIQSLRKAAYEEVRSKFVVEELKNNPTVRAYRDLYWKLGVDPTKTRPSGEALLRRVLHGSDLPRISTVVDAYNLASMITIVPISGFDGDRLKPPFQVRFANSGETFTGIGMSKPMRLTDKMLVLADEMQVLSIYPYRDCDHTKITVETKNALIVAYGAPGIVDEQLRRAVESTISNIKLTSDGETGAIQVFTSTSGDVGTR
jgi:DNA/RNA-binding domain of Phe-tRNA-synthetase-like protein